MSSKINMKIKKEQIKLQSLVHNHNCNSKDQGLVWPIFVLK